jgi:hypothetical protein
LPATSRLIVEGARPSSAAISRSDRPAARPREISSRSSKLNRRDARRRGSGMIPPHRTRYERTVLVGNPNARAVGFIEWPDRIRRQISSISAGDNRCRC